MKPEVVKCMILYSFIVLLNSYMMQNRTDFDKASSMLALLSSWQISRFCHYVENITENQILVFARLKNALYKISQIISNFKWQRSTGLKGQVTVLSHIERFRDRIVTGEFVESFSLAPMSVKDVLQSLVDDNMVDTERVGTSNYYWAFPSKALNARKHRLEELERQVRASLSDIWLSLISTAAFLLVNMYTGKHTLLNLL